MQALNIHGGWILRILESELSHDPLMMLGAHRASRGIFGSPWMKCHQDWQGLHTAMLFSVELSKCAVGNGCTREMFSLTFHTFCFVTVLGKLKSLSDFWQRYWGTNQHWKMHCVRPAWNGILISSPVVSLVSVPGWHWLALSPFFLSVPASPPARAAAQPHPPPPPPPPPHPTNQPSHPPPPTPPTPQQTKHREY